MQIQTDAFIAQLIEQIRTQLNKVEQYKSLSPEALNQKATEESWSVLECIEHLNLYGDFYVPAIRESILASKSPASSIYKSGFLGNYFVKSMEPKEKLNKMKTFKDKYPASNLKIDVLDRFIGQQKDYLDLLEEAKKINLVKTKTRITLTKFLKLRIGDTFRFILAHNDRHLVQADRALDS